MEGLINYQNEGLLKELALMPMNSNTLWGTEYFLMDCMTFMGKLGGEQYDPVIDTFVKIWYTKRSCRDNDAASAFTD